MLQQNWQNVTLIFNKLLQQPSKINADISRVRQYFLGIAFFSFIN